MPSSELLRQAMPLLEIGLLNTLVATKRDDGFAISRLRLLDRKLTAESLAVLPDTDATLIGRVGKPDPAFNFPWPKTLTFYGKWFDDLATVDPSCALRKKIAQMPRATQISQVQKDEKFALVGTYYSVFQAIIDCKRRVPLILLGNTLRDESGLPVVLPSASHARFHKDMQAVLSVMLKIEREIDVIQDENGIAVTEISADEMPRTLVR